MDIVDYLHRLFAYDDWANREVLSSLRTAPNPPPQSLKLTAHILSAEGLWLARLKQQKPALSVWPELVLAQCKAEADMLGASWRSYLEECREADLSHQIRYVNSKGETWSSQVNDVLLHVITHSAYHRGQIASDMRAAGLTPAYTDFIHAIRQELVK